MNHTQWPKLKLAKNWDHQLKKKKNQIGKKLHHPSKSNTTVKLIELSTPHNTTKTNAAVSHHP